MTAAPWMTPDDLADWSGIPVETIRHHLRSDNIPGAHRAGRSWIMPTAAAKVWADNYSKYGTLRKAEPDGTPPSDPALSPATSTALTND